MGRIIRVDISKRFTNLFHIENQSTMCILTAISLTTNDKINMYS